MMLRAKTIWERLDGTKKLANFEINALYPSQYSREISKIADSSVALSRSYIVLALEHINDINSI